MSQKLFSEKQINISAILGGFISAAILIYLNFKTLGKNKQANYIAIFTILFTPIFFYLLFQIPSEIMDKIPNFVFSLFYGLMAIGIYKMYLEKDVILAFNSGAIKKSNWTVIPLIILGLILNVSILIGISIDQPYYDSEFIIVESNELYYDNNISSKDAEVFLTQLKNFGFFEADYGNIARIQSVDGEYYFTILVDKDLWLDTDIIDSMIIFKSELNNAFNTSVHLKLESVSLSGKITFKEI